MQNTGRMRMLVENYLSAKMDGLKEGYDVKTVEEDNYEHFYILFKPLTGLYKDQYHIIEMKTTYGHGVDTVRYPINAPFIKFNTAVFHTNISTGGAICLDILKDSTKWVPTYDFSSVIRNILLLFEEPNNASPFNGEASRLYVDCEKKFKAVRNKRMSYQETEALKARCFEDFKHYADTYASKNEKELQTTYSKWFPQLLGKERDMEEIEELKVMLESLRNSRKKKKEEQTNDNSTNTENKTNDNKPKEGEQPAKSTEEKKIDETSNKPQKKVIDTSKFAKYQKKKT